MWKLRSALLPFAALSMCLSPVPCAWAHDQQQPIDVAGLERTFTLFVPDNLVNVGHRIPVVVILHGGLETGAIIRRQMRVDAVAEREGFGVIYPDGLQRGWNDGRQERLRQRGEAGQADDVAFLEAVVQRVIHQGVADPQRIYLTGVSNGGMMALRMGCEASEMFAGIAAVIANLPTDIAGSCKPTRPTPMLFINGTADPLVPWVGGGVGFGGRRGNVLSTEETVAVWLRTNGCSENGISAKLPGHQDDGPLRAEVTLYKDCRSGAPVVLVRIEGGGHRIPGPEDRPHPIVDRALGPQSHDFETAELVWQFYARPSDF